MAPFIAAHYEIPPDFATYAPRYCDGIEQENAVYHAKSFALIKEIITRKFAQHRLPYKVESVTYCRRLPRCRAPDMCFYKVIMDTSQTRTLDLTDQGQVKSFVRELNGVLRDCVPHLSMAVTQCQELICVHSDKVHCVHEMYVRARKRNIKRLTNKQTTRCNV